MQRAFVSRRGHSLSFRDQRSVQAVSSFRHRRWPAGRAAPRSSGSHDGGSARCLAGRIHPSPIRSVLAWRSRRAEPAKSLFHIHIKNEQEEICNFRVLLFCLTYKYRFIMQNRIFFYTNFLEILVVSLEWLR